MNNGYKMIRVELYITANPYTFHMFNVMVDVKHVDFVSRAIKLIFNKAHGVSGKEQDFMKMFFNKYHIGYQFEEIELVQIEQGKTVDPDGKNNYGNDYRDSDDIEKFIEEFNFLSMAD